MWILTVGRSGLLSVKVPRVPRHREPVQDHSLQARPSRTSTSPGLALALARRQCMPHHDGLWQPMLPRSPCQRRKKSGEAKENIPILIPFVSSVWPGLTAGATVLGSLIRTPPLPLGRDVL